VHRVRYITTIIEYSQAAVKLPSADRSMATKRLATNGLKHNNSFNVITQKVQMHDVVK